MAIYGSKDNPKLPCNHDDKLGLEEGSEQGKDSNLVHELRADIPCREAAWQKMKCLLENYTLSIWQSGG